MIRRMTFGMLLRGIGQRGLPTYIPNICICVMLIRPKLWKCGLFVAKSEPGSDPEIIFSQQRAPRLGMIIVVLSASAVTTIDV